MRFQLASLIFTLLFLLASTPAVADFDPPVIDRKGDCTTVQMCVLQTATGDCTENPAAGDERVFNAIGFGSLTFWSLASVGSYSCDVISNPAGHDDGLGVGHQINVTSIADETPVLTVKGNVGHVWINCSEIASSATVTLQACVD